MNVKDQIYINLGQLKELREAMKELRYTIDLLLKGLSQRMDGGGDATCRYVDDLDFAPIDSYIASAKKDQRELLKLKQQESALLRKLRELGHDMEDVL